MTNNHWSLTTLLYLPVALLLCQASRADDPKSGKREDVKIIKVDGSEPLVGTFSLDRATAFLDRTSMAWTKKHKCFTCHTNFIHLIALSDFEKKPRYYQTVRESLGELVSVRWKEKGPRWDAEVVMAAATLALVDRSGSGELSPVARQALDRVWDVQREDGGFDWLKCDWPPMESDDEYGAAMAAVAWSAAPANYRKTEAASQGRKRLKDYIREQGLKRLHHRGLLVWADRLGGDWLSEEEVGEIKDQILKIQNGDGGWNTPSIGKWKREDDREVDRNSDGYGTGFAIFVLRQAGLPSDHPAIAKGIAWLKANQRASGRWYTRSVSRDNRHYLTHAGTAMAIMALKACE